MLLASRLGVLPVGLSVGLGSFGGVVCGMVKMALGDMGMMRGGMVIAGFMASSGLAMVPGCEFVVFGCFTMMLNGVL